MSQSRAPVDTMAGQAVGPVTDIPSMMSCGFALIVMIVVLRTCGFVRALRLARWMTRTMHPTSDAAFEAAQLIARRVALVAAFYPGRARCLEQSLTLYWLLRRVGMAAELRLGVQPVSFAAHAWVEYQREPVHEGELVSTVLALPELPL